MTGTLRLAILGGTMLLATSVTSPASAHDEVSHCEAVIKSIEDAGFGDAVTVECVAGQAIIHSTTYPDHPMMTGIVGTNEQVPVPAADYATPIPLAPELGAEPLTRDAALGVAVNGVPIYDYTAGGEMTLADLLQHQAEHDTVQTQQLDACGGHAGRGDDYHYHAKPTCMIAEMTNPGPGAIIGWALDGFPIYGDTNPDGTVIAAGGLDVCNGQPDDTFIYRYHTSIASPYIIQCLMGKTAALADLPRVPPLHPADGSRGPEAGVPPRDGVENLVFTEDATGMRMMTYSYQGQDYYISYSPSGTPNCYNFETRTVTNGGALFTAELCR